MVKLLNLQYGTVPCEAKKFDTKLCLQNQYIPLDENVPYETLSAKPMVCIGWKGLARNLVYETIR